MTLPVVSHLLSLFLVAVRITQCVQVMAQRSVVRSRQVDFTSMHARKRYKTVHPCVRPLFYQNKSVGTSPSVPNLKGLDSGSQDQYLINHYKMAGFKLSEQGRLRGCFMPDMVQLDKSTKT